MEKLQQHNIYPIVILIKFKSVKHIKEINIWDSKGGGQQDKPSMKDAKNMQEHSVKLEQEYRHVISDTVQAGPNIMLICGQVGSNLGHRHNNVNLLIRWPPRLTRNNRDRSGSRLEPFGDKNCSFRN